MSWAQSLIKLSAYEVEILQKRLSEVAARREQAELALAMLEAEGEAEALRSRDDAASGWYHIGFLQGLRVRKAEARKLIQGLRLEERGALDVLAEAFETQKKYEHIADGIALNERREANRREAAAYDELALRKRAN